MALPERLKAAREARGWSVEEVGAQLRLPARLVARIESGDFEGLGAPIYRRGYLRSFARLVGVPEDEVEAALRDQLVPEPELIATGVMPRGEYVTERYLRPATYIALTALIALPVVWWAASGRLGQELASNRSFDLQPPAALISATGEGEPARPARPEPLPLETPPQQELFRASMMAVPPDLPEPSEPDAEPPRVAAPAIETPAAVEETVADGQVVGSGANEAVLELVAQSWVEVVGPDGRRLHHALLAPGEWRFRSDGRLSFTIGNSRDARLSADGRTIDLDAHRSSNDVARVELFGDG